MVFQLDNLADATDDIADLVFISTQMRLAADETTVNHKVAVHVAAARYNADDFRKIMNFAASTCGDDNRVKEKARKGLQMLSEFESILDSLQSKLDAAGVRVDPSRFPPEFQFVAATARLARYLRPLSRDPLSRSGRFLRP